MWPIRTAHLRKTLTVKLGGRRVRLTPLARGAVAHVYRARTRGDDPDLSAKILCGRYRQHQTMLGAIEREYDILRSIDHRGVPQAVDCGRVLGRPYLSYRYIDGEPLLARLQATAGDGSQDATATRWMLELLDVLTHLQRGDAPIAHGDISPENLLVDAAGQVHLIDFGAAQRAGDSAGVHMLGKPSYMSPEQAQGRAWDHRSDLYQAGVIWFESLTGKRYNPGTSALDRRLFSANPSIDLEAFVGPPVLTILRRLLCVDPAHRWHSAAACASALRRLQRRGQAHE